MNSEENNRQTIQVWCHVCRSEGTGKLNADTFEYNCNTCMSECVEEVSQGVENFIGVSNTSHSGASRAVSEISETQRQNLATINSALQSGGRITHIARSTASGRPVGVIIRHVTTDVPLQSGGTGLQGLLNTLNSVASNETVSEDDVMARIMHHILMNERSRAGAPPASDELLNSLSKQTITESESLSELGECNITQEPFEVGDVMVCLPCEHRYKEESIVQWLKMHNTCPVCRVEVVLPSSDSPDATPEPISSETNPSTESTD